MLAGDFDLAKISFPIWCMVPRSVLEIYGAVAGPIAPYLNAAALSDDPLFRMKMVMTLAIAFLNPCHTWGKPLNPVLGETYQAILPDGGRVDVEQISHHPPRAAVIITGPKEIYCFTGQCEMAIIPSINSMRLVTKGFKQVEFADGHTISFENY